MYFVFGWSAYTRQQMHFSLIFNSKTENTEKKMKTAVKISVLPSRLTHALTDSLLTKHAFKRGRLGFSWWYTPTDIAFMRRKVSTVEVQSYSASMKTYTSLSERLSSSLRASLAEELRRENGETPWSVWEYEKHEAVMVEKCELDARLDVWDDFKRGTDWRSDLLIPPDYFLVRQEVEEAFESTGYACVHDLFDCFPKPE